MADALRNLKTDESLLKRLEAAHAPSREEVERQRVSFVYGLLDEKTHITREEVKKRVEQLA